MPPTSAAAMGPPSPTQPRAATRPRPIRRRPPRRPQRPPPVRTVPRPAAAAAPAPAIERAPLPRPPGILVKKYLIAGLLVWLPLAITLWVLHAILNTLDGVFEALLSASQAVLPEAAHGPLEFLKKIPGLC